MIAATCAATEERRCKAAHWIIVLCMAGVGISCQALPTPTPIPTSTPALASLRLEVSPAGAVVYIDGQEKGRTPLTLDLPAGSYTVRVQRDGYAPLQRDAQLLPGEQMLIAEALRDTALPLIALDELPESVQAGQAVHIRARASDNESVTLMRLRINGESVVEVKGQALEHTWNTGFLAVGLYAIAIEASDDSGNIRQVMRNVDVHAGPTPALSPTPKPEAPVRPAAYTYEKTITLLTYPYEPYLRKKIDPRYNFEVLWLDRAAYEASRPRPQRRTFRAIVLENRYLSLTFLPELGGRLYGCTLKSTGDSIFYQNAVLKPSYWGPLSRAENWWLAAGGMEWALPVQEHGYEWGIPWTYQVEQQGDQVSLVLRDHVASDRLRAEIRVTLTGDRAYFIVEPRLLNPTSQAIACQFWLNAALTLGSISASANTEFVYPTGRMVVHSTGDSALPGERQTMPWPIYDGRDLSYYRNWRNWLGVFVPDVQQDYAGAYNHDTELGIARVFPAGTVPGLKLFAFGADFPAGAEYSDDGSEYFEMWAGPCKTFWPEDDVALGPGQSLQWSEVWLPFRGIGGLDRANAEVVVKTSVQSSQVHLGIAVSRARRIQYSLWWNGQIFHQAAANVSPDAPLVVQVPLANGAILPGDLTVQVQDYSGTDLLEYVKTVAP